MSPATWNIVGSLLTGLGALIALSGSLMMARGYLSMPLLQFLVQAPRLVLFSLLRKNKELEDEVDLAEANKESRVRTLVGLCQIVIGFFLQTLGTIFLYLGTLPNGR